MYQGWANIFSVYNYKYKTWLGRKYLTSVIDVTLHSKQDFSN